MVCAGILFAYQVMSAFLGMGTSDSFLYENIRLEDGTGGGLLLEETDGDNIITEDEDTSAGENILLENAADSGDKAYLLQETYIVGDASTTSSDLDKSAQNELFDQLDDDVLDFSETNPFGDAGGT